MSSLKKVKEEAWVFYRKWRKERTYAPAFKSEVRVSLMGWRHISGATGYKKRTLHDTYRRLKLVPYAKEIIEKQRPFKMLQRKANEHFTHWRL